MAVKQRMCCVCRSRKDAVNLIRIAREKNADSSFRYFVDKKGNANGRGCHICAECLPKAIKNRALNKSFKANVGDEIYNVLAKVDLSVYTER